MLGQILTTKYATDEMLDFLFHDTTPDQLHKWLGLRLERTEERLLGIKGRLLIAHALKAAGLSEDKKKAYKKYVADAEYLIGVYEPMIEIMKYNLNWIENFCSDEYIIGIPGIDY